QKPFMTLTIQSALPGTVLANGQSIAQPGESVTVKLLTQRQDVLGDGINGIPANAGSDDRQGAGFVVGLDNGVEPPADSLGDEGWYSQFRILGIGGNETTGQQRIPAILTSTHDDTVGPTVRGVSMQQVMSGNSTPPAMGDGGSIIFGGLSETDYNLQDPR